MIDARASFIALRDDSSLESLLADAQTKIAAVLPEDQTVEDVNKIANEVQASAAEVRRELMQEIEQKIALRREKVAIAVHMFKVASRLTA